MSLCLSAAHDFDIDVAAFSSRMVTAWPSTALRGFAQHCSWHPRRCVRGNGRRDVIKMMKFLTFAGRAATFWAIQKDAIVKYPSWTAKAVPRKTVITCHQPLALQLGAGDEGLLLWRCHHSSWGIMWWKWCADENRSNVIGLDLLKAEKPYTRITIPTIFTSMDATRCYIVHHFTCGPELFMLSETGFAWFHFICGKNLSS